MVDVLHVRSNPLDLQGEGGSRKILTIKGGSRKEITVFGGDQEKNMSEAQKCPPTTTTTSKVFMNTPLLSTGIHFFNYYYLSHYSSFFHPVPVPAPPPHLHYLLSFKREFNIQPYIGP